MNEKFRILIVDDDHAMANTLRDIFKAKAYEAQATYSGPEALDKVKKDHFDCVLTDIKMPEVNGVELYRAIKALRPDLPVVLMTSYSADVLVKEGLEEGAIATLTKPLDINLLFSFFSSLRKEQSVVIVDDNPQFCKTLGDILRTRGLRVAEVTDPHSLLKAVRPDAQVVLLDMKLNTINGFDVLKAMRQRYPHVPVFLVTGYREEMASMIEAVLQIKAYTCLYKPLQIEELVELLTEVYY